MIRVFVVCDPVVARLGISELINAAPDLDMVERFHSVGGGVVKTAAAHPSFVILDLSLPWGDGIALYRSIRSQEPEALCLVLTAYDDHFASLDAVTAGPSGYELKRLRNEKLIDTIRLAAREQVVASLGTKVDAAITQPGLTLRERQVLKLISGGMTNKQIGKQLGLAEKTVKNYVSGLLSKLGLERRTQAAVYGATHRDRMAPSPVSNEGRSLRG